MWRGTYGVGYTILWFTTKPENHSYVHRLQIAAAISVSDHAILNVDTQSIIPVVAGQRHQLEALFATMRYIN